MKINLFLRLIFLILILNSCGESSFTNGIEGTTICNFSDVEVSDSDNLVSLDNAEPTYWKGNYNENAIRIYFTKKLNNHGASETLNFVFNKIDDCLQIDRGYEFYNGGTSDVSAITQVYVQEVYIKNWEVDKNFSGQIVYIDHHDKKTKNINFWLDFTTDDYSIENTNYTYFSDCFENKLPIHFDLDKDGTTDYSIVSEKIMDFANQPNFDQYTIKLVSTDESINEIMSPKGTSIPFPVIFEPPFSSENTRGYAANKFNSADVRNALDVFYEFDAPYESYNFFLNNNLTYQNEFNNNKDDYYVIKLIRNNESYYGWIRLDFNALNCEISVVETFINQNPNEHISVD